jgi:predicted ATPase
MSAADPKPEARAGVPPLQRRCRIVLTGGPGGGKTTAADLFRRELGESVVVVPESATILFAGGFPRAAQQVDAERSIQTAIFHVQRSLEDVQSARYPERILLCDRGTIDGAAYWPNGDRDFFQAMGTTFEAELERYDAVVFFETAAVAGDSIEGGNPVRNESMAEAVALDGRLRKLWARHPRFTLVPHSPSFLHKITAGLGLLQSIVDQARR